MASVFFSYTHVDEALRNQLEVHLALLKREGLISAWHDRRIEAGANINSSIDAELEKADIILLLVSANFIASDYCFSIEMTRAMERHTLGECSVVPVILRACDWHTAPFGELLAVPTDGRPVTSWPNQDEAFADATKYIRKLVSGMPKATPVPPQKTTQERNPPSPLGALMANSQASIPRSSNLRVRHQFSDLDATPLCPIPSTLSRGSSKVPCRSWKSAKTNFRVAFHESMHAASLRLSTRTVRVSRNALSPMEAFSVEITAVKSPTPARCRR